MQYPHLFLDSGSDVEDVAHTFHRYSSLSTNVWNDKQRSWNQDDSLSPKKASDSSSSVRDSESESRSRKSVRFSVPLEEYKWFDSKSPVSSLSKQDGAFPHKSRPNRWAKEWVWLMLIVLILFLGISYCFFPISFFILVVVLAFALVALVLSNVGEWG